MKDNMITNAGVRSEIDAVCKDLLMENVDEYISAPVILTFFLGEETYDVVNASLKDAFTTSFKLYQMYMISVYLMPRLTVPSLRIKS